MFGTPLFLFFAGFFFYGFLEERYVQSLQFIYIYIYIKEKEKERQKKRKKRKR